MCRTIGAGNSRLRFPFENIPGEPKAGAEPPDQRLPLRSSLVERWIRLSEPLTPFASAMRSSTSSSASVVSAVSSITRSQRPDVVWTDLTSDRDFNRASTDGPVRGSICTNAVARMAGARAVPGMSVYPLITPLVSSLSSRVWTVVRARFNRRASVAIGARAFSARRAMSKRSVSSNCMVWPSFMLVLDSI